MRTILNLSFDCYFGIFFLRCTDPCEQLAYVAAFTISSYSTTAIRAAKPFNPLLGETYELDRTEDLGFRVINEQVSSNLI